MNGNIVIYTCIIGTYDELLQPVVTEQGFDFVCYVSKGEKTAGKLGVWEIRELDVPGIDKPSLLSRYAKMHPHLLFPDYQVSIWIDGNVQIVDATMYKAAHIKEAAGVKYSGVSHPSRDCSYAEAKKCRDMHYLSYLGLLRVWLFLLWGRVPRHAGLMENNLIFRRHNDPDIISLDQLWWDKLLHLSGRDQLSLIWCLRRMGIKLDYLLPPGQNTRNHPGFRYLLHK